MNRLPFRLLHSSPLLLTRPFTTTRIHPSKFVPRNLPPRPVLHDDDIIENFLRGTGPGGQKINKTSCAVQLIHKPTGIVVKCQESRSRTQNRKIARKWLQDKIEEAELGDKARTRLKAEDKRRRKKSMDKKKRRKYRALEEGKNADGEEVEEEEDEVEEGEDVGVEDVAKDNGIAGSEVAKDPKAG